MFTRRFSAILLSGCALVSALAGCAGESIQRPRPLDAAQRPSPPDAPLPRLESARTRTEHEELEVWYEREANSAERQVAVHARMRDEDAAAAEHCRVLIFGHELRAEGSRALARLHRMLAVDADE